MKWRTGYLGGSVPKLPAIRGGWQCLHLGTTRLRQCPSAVPHPSVAVSGSGSRVPAGPGHGVGYRLGGSVPLRQPGPAIALKAVSLRAGSLAGRVRPSMLVNGSVLTCIFGWQSLGWQCPLAPTGSGNRVDGSVSSRQAIGRRVRLEVARQWQCLVGRPRLANAWVAVSPCADPSGRSPRQGPLRS